MKHLLILLLLTCLMPVAQANEPVVEPEASWADPAGTANEAQQVIEEAKAALERALEAVPASGAEFLHRGEVGVASFYSMAFKGRKTASGDRFDPYAGTAAHRTLPLGTEVRITNLDNGRSVKAVINDRGPFVRGRIVDVSYMLARQLDFVRAGIARVKVEVQSWGAMRRLRTTSNERN